MMSGSARSKASATARVIAVTMFTQRIWTGVIGSTPPSMTAAMMVRAWPPLVGRMNRIDFFRLS